MRIALNQTHRRFSAKPDVGFVDHHHRFAVGLQQALDLGQRQQPPGGGIGIGENDAAVGDKIILDANLKAVRERDFLVLNIVQAAIHRIKTVGDIGKQDRLIVFQQRQKRVRQHLVGAVADKHLRKLYTMKFRNRFAQPVRMGVRVQPQAVSRLQMQGFQHLRAWSVGIFIGVELDQIGQLGLFARHVRR